MCLCSENMFVIHNCSTNSNSKSSSRTSIISINIQTSSNNAIRSINFRLTHFKLIWLPCSRSCEHHVTRAWELFRVTKFPDFSRFSITKIKFPGFSGNFRFVGTLNIYATVFLKNQSLCKVHQDYTQSKYEVSMSNTV